MNAHPAMRVAVAVLLTVAVVVALRLFRLWWRTRELPELLAALGLFSFAPVAASFGFLAIFLAPTRPDLAPHLLVAGMAASLSGVLFAAFFTAIVFRPHSRGALAFASAAGVVLWSTWLGAVLVGDSDPRHSAGTLRNLLHVAEVGPLLWGSLESLVYWRTMKRRLAFGMADPVVVNRFALWSLVLGLLGVVIGMVSVANAPGLQWAGPFIVLPVAVGGVVAIVSLMLAFLPPRWYLAWLERRAPARSA